MSVISAIDKQTVHRICSGQVVLDLATAVKELIENSVDAGSTSIEIKFKENALDGLEVIDNGSGIAPENYESLALKHHTSKIERFEDLESVATFGFRGEAISSLCALCEVVVTTATKDQAPRGIKLVYDYNGHLVSQMPVARTVGTTVQLTKLFHTLPVRRQEFERNVKREYGKALAMIQAYGIISNKIKIVATNQVARGSTTRAVATNGNKAVRENIMNIFGAKMLPQIMPFEVALDPVLEQIGDDENRSNCVIHGFISKPEFGYGRSSGDRQYFFINGRPCILPKLAKAFNELYRTFVTNQYPFIVADIRLAPNKYDVNVTPDKRTILLHDEQAMILHVVEGLREQLEPSRSSFVTQPFSVSQNSPGNAPRSPPEQNQLLNETVPTTPVARSIPRDTPQPQVSTPRSFPLPMPSTPRVTRAPLSSYVCSRESDTRPLNTRKRKDTSIADYLSKRRKTPPSETLSTPTNHMLLSPTEDPMELVDELVDDNEQSSPVNIDRVETAARMEMEAEGVEETNEQLAIHDHEMVVWAAAGPWYTRDKKRIIDVKPHAIQSPLYAKHNALSPCIDTHTLQGADLTNVNDNETAVAALRRVIKKTDFVAMKVIGQFNLGFIITLLGEHDLFIVDQHASDEKFNFETLQLTTKLQGQRLIEPQNPELTAAEELVVMENQEIIRANGFDLEIDETKEPSKRVRVASQPMSNDIMFDKKDFGELVYALSERPGQMVHCSRARKIFASKACRKSVMIGHPLNARKMSQIVQNMGNLDQPWNCPHGRPTMRHLCSIVVASRSRRKERPMEYKGSLFR